jgi:hypothetical protein
MIAQWLLSAVSSESLNILYWMMHLVWHQHVATLSQGGALFLPKNQWS